MELKEYLSVIKKHIWLLLIIIAVIIVGVIWYSYKMPVTYDSSAFVTVAVQSKNSSNQMNYYDYDNYYSIQGSGFFADNIISWLSDPSNVSEIFSNAKIERPDVNLKKMSKVIQTKKKVPNSVQIMYNDANQSSSESVVRSTIDFIKEKTQNWNKNGLVKDIYIDSSTVISVAKKPDILLNTLIGLAIGLIIGLMAVFVSENLTGKK